MIVNRRLFMAGCASLPLVTSLKSVPGLAAVAATPACVGEVWGLPFWAKGVEQAPMAFRRKPSAPPAWHSEFG